MFQPGFADSVLGFYISSLEITLLLEIPHALNRTTV